LHGGYAGQGLQVHAQTFISYVTRKFHVIELCCHVRWSYCWTICTSLHREPSDNLLGELQNVIILLTVGLLFCSGGQVQEEMPTLKIINCSGVTIQSVKIIYGLDENDIPINSNCEHNYRFPRYLDYKGIRLRLPSIPHVDHPFIFLDNIFVDDNEIAYVRKGAGDHWFVDPIRRGAKLVRKRVCNSTPSQIAVAEFASERNGETRRLLQIIAPAPWTAWWETEIASRTNRLLIVDPANGHRKYFARGAGLPLVGNDPDVQVLRQQNNNVPIHEINMASPHNEHVEVKEIPGGLLVLTSSWRPWFLV
jgi:hypothetical protein